MKNKIAANLSRILDGLNMTLTDLVKKCDAPADTIKKIYYGTTDNPKIETLLDICDTLNISIDYLIGRIDYRQDEIELLKNYKNTSNHGKSLIQEIAKHEADYTKFENNQNFKYKITCVEPTGFFENGVLWDSCIISTIETYDPSICFAFKIPTNKFIPTYAKNEILYIQHRVPEEGENALFYKDNMLYVRKLKYDEEHKKYVLKGLSIGSTDIKEKSLANYHIIGTIIAPKRSSRDTNKDKIEKEIVLPLDIKELVDKIKRA